MDLSIFLEYLCVGFDDLPVKNTRIDYLCQKNCLSAANHNNQTPLHMTHEQKLQVKDALMRYVDRFDSHILAAKSLVGVSGGAISHIKHNNWDLLNEQVWQVVARQVGFYCGDWAAADTSTHMLLRILLSDAQLYGMTYGAAIGNGLGKTFAATRYMRQHEQVCYIACKPGHNRMQFTTDLLRAAGISAEGTVPELIQAFITAITAKDQPLLIIDDAHLLKDRVLHLVVALSNALTGRAGILLMGNEELPQQIAEGARGRKAGYLTLFNTFGRRFITLTRPSPRDAELICRANGITDDYQIAGIAAQCTSGFKHISSLVAQSRPMDIAA